MTPLTAHRLAELSVGAGIPAGVINIVHGLGNKAGRALTTHDGIAAISFTGGTVTGAAVAANAAPRFKKLSLALGGKNPTIVFADADMTEAFTTSVRAAFWNQGEICLCGSRIFVERPAYDKFVEGFVRIAKELRIGEDIGALISAAHLGGDGLHRSGEERGGTIVTGGRRVDRKEYFVEPTVITGLDCNRVLQEEIFGPVVTVHVDGERASRCEFTPRRRRAWARDPARASRCSSVDSGTVWINCASLRDLRVPFGGMKVAEWVAGRRRFAELLHRGEERLRKL